MNVFDSIDHPWEEVLLDLKSLRLSITIYKINQLSMFYVMNKRTKLGLRIQKLVIMLNGFITLYV